VYIILEQIQVVDTVGKRNRPAMNASRAARIRLDREASASTGTLAQSGAQHSLCSSRTCKSYILTVQSV
jgi:hypothetical protein